MSEHQRDAENRTDRIRDPSAGDVGRRAVDGLIESTPHAGGCGIVAERRRWKYTQRSGQHRRLVGEDVAEHVLRHYYIEAARIAQKLHRAGVHQQMVERDVGELVAQYASDGRAPQPRSFENVRFVHGRQLAPPGARELGGYARHALDLESRVHTLVDRALSTGHLFAALVAEVHTTC